MHNVPSRKEKRETKFINIAKSGNFETTAYLFKSEAVCLRKQNFAVIREGIDEKKSLPSKVSWKKAFGSNIPPSVKDYISGKTKTFPKVLNWAEELFVIAARACYLKAQTNYE